MKIGPTRLPVDAFESSLPENAEAMLSDEKNQIEKLRLDFCQDEVKRVFDSNEYVRWIECFHQFVIDLKENGSDLAKFWLSYVELCELLLNLIFATRSGNWQLYLSCIEETILWAFAYDRQNYAQYLVPYLNDMLGLPVTMSEVYSAFTDGQLSVQMGKVNLFGQNEADKTIENTINKDCKTGGATSDLAQTSPQHGGGFKMLQDVVHIEKYSENIYHLSQPVCVFTKN